MTKGILGGAWNTMAWMVNVCALGSKWSVVKPSVVLCVDVDVLTVVRSPLGFGVAVAERG